MTYLVLKIKELGTVTQDEDLKSLIIRIGIIVCFFLIPTSQVSLSLLKHYQYQILQLDNMETITEFLKTAIPSRVTNDSSEILHSATQLGDLSSKLKTFETEYLVMHELMSTFHLEKKVAISDTEAMNDLLRKQNKDLIEQVVYCRGAIMRLESSLDALQQAYTDQQKQLSDQQLKLNR